MSAPWSSRRLGRVGWAVVLALLVAPLAVVVAIGWGAEQRWDVGVERAVHSYVLDRRWVFDIAHGVTHLGDPVVVTIGTGLLAVALFALSRRRCALYVLLVRVLALAADSGLKHAVGRARPVLAHPLATAGGPSFPSGHAFGSAALWGSLAVVLAGSCGLVVRLLVATIVPVLVAASRVLIGVHFVTDVVAGLAWGWALALLLAAALGVPRRGSPSMAPVRRKHA